MHGIHLFAFAFCFVCFGQLTQGENKPADSAKAGNSTASASPKEVITQQKAEELLKQPNPPILIDVRTSEEFKEGHLKGAQNIDFLDSHFESNLAALDKEKTYLVYCAMGGRSSRAVTKMKALGFTHYYDLSGGFNAWLKAGKPVEK